MSLVWIYKISNPFNIDTAELKFLAELKIGQKVELL